jgi:chorismate mutase
MKKVRQSSNPREVSHREQSQLNSKREQAPKSRVSAQTVSSSIGIKEKRHLSKSRRADCIQQH